jgi:antitoxin MazE
MSTIVRSRIVKIGNSQGVRIPRLLLDQTNLGEEVELEVEEGKIIIRTAQAARKGWEEQFKQMAEQGDDRLLDDTLSTTSWDEAEWEW